MQRIQGIQRTTQYCILEGNEQKMGSSSDILEIYCLPINSYTMKNGNVAKIYNMRIMLIQLVSFRSTHCQTVLTLAQWYSTGNCEAQVTNKWENG